MSIDVQPRAGDELLHRNEWLSLYRRGDYVFSHETRSDGNLVAILVYRTDYSGKTILGRYEITPCHDDGMILTTITGGVDIDNSVFQTFVDELWEEAGYKFDPHEDYHRLTQLGYARPSKSADTKMWYFAFDATGLDRREQSIGDGSKGEEGASCDWVTAGIASWAKDPHMAAMMARMTSKGVPVPWRSKNE